MPWQEFFQLAYSTGDCLAQYHVIQKDKDITVTPWNGGKRSVCFIMETPIPASIAKMIGTDSVIINVEVGVCEAMGDQFWLIYLWSMWSQKGMAAAGGTTQRSMLHIETAALLAAAYVCSK